MNQRRVVLDWKRSLAQTLSSPQASAVGGAERVAESHDAELIFPVLLQLAHEQEQRRWLRELGGVLIIFFVLVVGISLALFAGDGLAPYWILLLLSIVMLIVPSCFRASRLWQNALFAALHLIEFGRVQPSVSVLCGLLFYGDRLPQKDREMLTGKLAQRLTRLSNAEAVALEETARLYLLKCVAQNTDDLAPSAMIALTAAREPRVHALLQSLTRVDIAEERRSIVEECLRLWDEGAP